LYTLILVRSIQFCFCYAWGQKRKAHRNEL